MIRPVASRLTLSPGDRVWAVQDGQRVVHIVEKAFSSGVEMKCGVLGEIATPYTARARFPFVSKTFLNVTCVFCLSEAP